MFNYASVQPDSKFRGDIIVLANAYVLLSLLSSFRNFAFSALTFNYTTHSDVVADESIRKLSNIKSNFVAVLAVSDGVKYTESKVALFSTERKALEMKIQKLYNKVTGLRVCGETNRCHGRATLENFPNSWDAYVFRSPLPRINWYSLRPAIFMNQFGAENAAAGTLAAAGLTASPLMIRESAMCNPCSKSNDAVNLRHFHCSRKKMHVHGGRIYIEHNPKLYPGAKIQV